LELPHLYKCKRRVIRADKKLKETNTKP
jgi:hypothetical protein